MSIDEEEIMKALVNCRSKRLRLHMQRLLKLLGLFSKDLRINQFIDDFYYRQKHQELETLEENLDSSLRQTLRYINQMKATHNEVAERWKIDFKTLKRSINKAQTKPVKNEEIIH